MKTAFFLIFLLLGLCIANLLCGEASLTDHVIFWELRMPRMLTALSAGMALACSGLLLQTIFKNPLAEPYILGIQGGASIGMAFWYLVMPMIAMPFFLKNMGPLAFAFFGACGSIAMLFALSAAVKNSTTLLIVGVILSSLCNSILSVLIPMAEGQGIKLYLVWGLGSFERPDLPLASAFLGVTCLILCACVAFSRSLNVLLAGEHFILGLGKKIRLSLLALLGLSSLLGALVTVVCGPISFVGMISPHLARLLVKRSHHGVMIGASVLVGGILSLFLQLTVTLFPGYSLTLNALAGILGAPIILAMILQNRGIR